ncbi:hypothetical protein DOTSEDRAFT_69581 [Dothistroma septosporum NZE10]|uniref:Uncharacterized protein n=1 Tax=Dothistroma septosporum (strain NZE10 / CBS 128990) TaxID=675120 RepID=N1PZ80_DOTSN|nr:hypothetical protein DOTSEDRAFT_69581 [Dothistroma septosporum NZE10]
MFVSQSLVMSLLALAGASSEHSIEARRTEGNNVTIVTLEKNYNSTGGSGSVAAAGALQPFGGIGIGCGIDWDDNVGYGGGLNAGSEAFGLGGGYTITPDTMEIGNGIGINGKHNATANVLFKGSTNGTFELRFESTAKFACVPWSNGTVYSVICSTVTAEPSYVGVNV